jgi:hypothetical protein
MSRKVPKIYAGNTVKKRDRQSFKNFVLEVIKDTFINEFTPTSSSLDSSTQTLFTLFLGPKDAVDNAYDYLDVYLYGVKQNRDKYDVKLYDGEGTELLTGQFASGSKEIRMIFNEDITRVPNDVPDNAFTIKGKIVEIQ